VYAVSIPPLPKIETPRESLGLIRWLYPNSGMKKFFFRLAS
jgi:hypothetical protein